MMQRKVGLVVLVFLFEFGCLWQVRAQTTEGSGETTMSPFEDCTGYPTLANANAFTGDTSDDSTVNVVCNNDYVNPGAEQFICNNGEWDPSGNGGDPYCARVCANPQIANGVVDLINNCNYESCVAEFSCILGYVLSGQKQLTCQTTGSFGALPTCQLIDCGDPTLANGGFTGLTTYGSEVTFTCNNPYILSGSETATCGPDRNWSELPTCLYTCEQLETIANANQVPSCSGTQLATCTVTVTCNAGFTLVGTNPVTCIQDQGWTGVPFCQTQAQQAAVTASVVLVIPMPPATTQANFIDIITIQLTIYYQSTMGGAFFRVVIVHISFRRINTGGRRKRQDGPEELADVEYKVITEDSPTAKGAFASAQADLVTTGTLEIEGQTVEPLETTVLGETYVRNETNVDEVSCRIFVLDNGECPGDSECQVKENNGVSAATCESTEEDDTLALELGLGLGIPLFLLTCALIIAAAYYAYVLKSRRRRHMRRKRVEPEDSDSATMSGFTPTRVPTRFNPGGRTGPVYGSYFPEAWNEAASIDDEDLRDPYYRHERPPSYLVSLGHEGRRHEPSNYSWDFMYPNVDKEFAMPRPRI